MIYLEKLLTLPAGYGVPFPTHYHFKYRNDHDLNTARCVFEQDEYRLGPLLGDEDRYKVTTVVDIGAGIGDFALAASVRFPEAQIFSFEPCLGSFQYLKLNTKWCPRVFPARYGITGRDTYGTVGLLHHRPEDKGGNYLPDFVPFGHFASEHIEEVPVSSLEQWIRLSGVSLDRDGISLLKIDTEGCELPILKSLEKDGTLKLYQVIVGEWHHQTQRPKIEELLKSCGYQVEMAGDPSSWNGFFSASLL